MKKVIKGWLIAVIVGLLAGPQFVSVSYGAASGNYTDLLPIGAAGNTTVISNGSGWSLTTLAPSQTFGDALSRAPMTVYQSTTIASISATTTQSTFTALSGQGKVGSTTFPASWVASGRSIRITAKGKYVTTGTPNWNWGVNLGTTSIVATGAISAPTSVTSTQSVTAVALLTIQGTGNTGTVAGDFQVIATTAAVVGAASGQVNTLSWSTGTINTVDLTSQLTVNPIFTWGTSSQGNTITFNNVLIEFLN